MHSYNKLVQKISLFFLFSTGLLAAPSGIYIEIGTGLGLNDTQKTQTLEYVYDKKFLGSFALGYQADVFRFEIEERYKKDALYSKDIGNNMNLKANGDFISNSQMFNVYFSGYNSSKLFTSVGAGAGITNLKLQEDTQNIKDEGILSLQAMLSVGYAITKDFAFITKYTYFYTKTSDNFKEKGESAISLHLRYIF